MPEDEVKLIFSLPNMLRYYDDSATGPAMIIVPTYAVPSYIVYKLVEET